MDIIFFMDSLFQQNHCEFYVILSFSDKHNCVETVKAVQ
ncbi:hypothetical protein B4086_3443 [Bacillus cereus]|nr:hypothetical protein B4086_3443 [Bacillus cereus]